MGAKDEKEKTDMDYDSGSTKSSKEGGNKGWVIALVTAISLARISHGLFLSITGPTLLFLAKNTNSDVAQVSAMFSGRSVGIFAGAVLFGTVSNKYPEHKPLFVLGLGLAGNGIVMLATPFLTSLAGLVIVTTVGGVMFGYLNSGLQAVYLRLWGEEGSRPYIQSIHFGFSVGALLAPIIATPFLRKASLEQESGTTCPGEIEVFTTAITFTNETTTSGLSGDEFNPINWCFIIIGVYTLLISVVLCALALSNVEDKVQTEHEDTTEVRQEEPIGDLYVFFITVCFYYFCCVTSEMVYQGYIYSVAICSDLQFEVTSAGILNSVFWLGFGIGRGSGIITSNYLKPSTMIILDLFGTTSLMTMMSIWGEQSPILTWAVTFLHGLSVATFYASGVSWTSQFTNMAGTYIFVFSIGGTLGSFSMMPAGGALFQNNPFSVMYLVTAVSVLNILAFVLMNITIRQKQQRIEKREQTKECSPYAIEGYDNYDFAVEISAL